MERKNVSSSNLASIGYDATKEILEVEFNNGAVYQYEDVPKEIYENLMNAPSQGVYFAAQIRNDYDCTKM